MSRLQPLGSMAVAWMIAAAAAPALATEWVLDFDGNTQSDFRLGVVERGFLFRSPLSSAAVVDGRNTQGAHNGTPTLWSYRHDLVMTRRDGQPFELLALDIGFYWLPDTQLADRVSATLTRPDGTTWSQQLEVSALDFQRWVFGGGLVRQVEFDQPYESSLRLDNLAVLSPVPEPGAAVLLLAGLAGLAGLRPWRRISPPAARAAR